MFLAAASQRTRRIRLGHGIVQLPLGFNHPARVAERIATLDLVSDGRVDFGTGEAELGGRARRLRSRPGDQARPMDGGPRRRHQARGEEPFAGYEGPVDATCPRGISCPSRCRDRTRRSGWRAAGARRSTWPPLKGIGALSFSFVEADEAKVWVEDYYDTIASEDCVPAGFAVNPNLACVLPLMCHEDEQTAIDRGLDGCHFFGYSLAHYYVFGMHRPGVTDIWQDFQENRDRFGFSRDVAAQTGQQLGAQLMEQGLGSLRGAIGTPAQIRELVRRYEEAGVDQLIFVSQAGRNRHEDICESLELFAREVMPEFQERAEEIDKVKTERLAPAVVAALARRDPPRPAPERLRLPCAAPTLTTSWARIGRGGEVPGSDSRTTSREGLPTYGGVGTEA